MGDDAKTLRREIQVLRLDIEQADRRLAEFKLTPEQLAALVKLVEGRTGYKLADMTPEEILRLNP